MIDFRFRAATESDFAVILALNLESEHFLSPLNPNKLERLCREAAVFQVATSQDLVAGFLLVFSPQADYDSPNFLWFKARYHDFLYVDRIVISEKFRGHHLASRFYEQLENHALAQGVARIVCEVNIDPPNPASLRFHESQGFGEIGRQSIPSDDKTGEQKIVSLQVKGLRHSVG
jgi:predicted GNAT superfamily acetyltransferase